MSKAMKGAAKTAVAGAARTVAGMIRLTVPAGKAAPAPPVGPALGQKGLNLMEFCKSFNDKTKDFKEQTPIPVVITAFSDRTFTYEMKTPQTTYLIKQATGIKFGASKPGDEVAGEINIKKIYEIAKIKQQDLSHIGLEQVCSQILATCKSMGVTVVTTASASPSGEAAEGDDATEARPAAKGVTKAAAPPPKAAAAAAPKAAAPPPKKDEKKKKVMVAPLTPGPRK